MRHLSFFFIPVLLFLVACTAKTRAPRSTPGISLSALMDFEPVESPDYIAPYRHQATNAWAVNAAKHKDRFALVETNFTGPSGSYAIELTTLRELDGESIYRLFIDGRRVAETKNAETDVDYAPQQHQLGKHRIRTGQTIGVAFSSSSNGKIPENGGFAFSRGRWTQLKLTK